MKKRRNHIIGLLLGLLCLALLTAGLKSCDSKVNLPSYDSSIVTPSANANAKKVDDLIRAIPTPVTLDSADAITKARQAYDALSDADKPFVTLLDKLKGFELDLANLGGNGLIANDAATLDNLLSGIKLPLDAEGIDLLGKIRAAFDGLSDGEKAKFKGLDLLEGLELSANGGAAELDNLLNGINPPISPEHSGVLRKIRSAYEGLPEAEKAKFKGLDKLKGFEWDLGKLDLNTPIATDAASLDGILDGLSQPITSDHSGILRKIRDAYEKLSDAEKAKFKGLDKLKGYELDLDNILKGDTPEAVDDLIRRIPTPIDLNCEDAINKAVAAYNALSDADKAKVKNFPQLQDYLDQLQKLKNGGTDLPKTGID